MGYTFKCKHCLSKIIISHYTTDLSGWCFAFISHRSSSTWGKNSRLRSVPESASRACCASPWRASSTIRSKRPRSPTHSVTFLHLLSQCHQMCYSPSPPAPQFWFYDVSRKTWPAWLTFELEAVRRAFTAVALEQTSWPRCSHVLVRAVCNWFLSLVTGCTLSHLVAESPTFTLYCRYFHFVILCLRVYI